MMLHVSILTPEETLFEGEAISVTAPGTLGYFEVFKDHAPFMSSLKAGKITLRVDEEKEETFPVSGGFFEVSHNKCIVLVDG